MLNFFSVVLKQTVPVPKALEKSARTIEVTSLLFIARFMSSLTPRRAVVVECSLQKLEMLSRRREALFCELRRLPADQPFATLDSTGNIEIGLSSLLVVGLSTLDISDTLAIFQSFGKYAPVIQPLMIQVRGPAKWSATSFMNVVRI